MYHDVSYAKGSSSIINHDEREGLQHIHSRKIFHRDDAWIQRRRLLSTITGLEEWGRPKLWYLLGIHLFVWIQLFWTSCSKKMDPESYGGCMEFDSARFWLAWSCFWVLLFLDSSWRVFRCNFWALSLQLTIAIRHWLDTIYWKIWKPKWGLNFSFSVAVLFRFDSWMLLPATEKGANKQTGYTGIHIIYIQYIHT